MKLTAAILTGLVLFSTAYSQDSRFVADMENALTIHDTASSVASEIEALEAFRGLCKKHNKEWLPSYWTAYLLTQVARLKGRSPDFPEDLDPAQLIIEAQERFDQASKVLPNKTDEQKSNFHMLQGFIYGWHETINAKNEEEKAAFKEKRQFEYKMAVKLNPQNPLMYVLAGIGMLREPRNYRDPLISVAILNYADEIFSRSEKRSMTTYWNKDFIPFWRSQAQKKLQEMLAND